MYIVVDTQPCMHTHTMSDYAEMSSMLLRTTATFHRHNET